MFTPKESGEDFQFEEQMFFQIGLVQNHHPVSALEFPGFPARSGVFSDSASLDGEPARLGEALQFVQFGLVELTVPEMSNEKRGPWLIRVI